MIPSLDSKDIKHFQAIVVAVLFYGWALDNKLIVALNDIGTQQATATESTNESINHILDYFSTYPNDSTVYRASNIDLAAHSYLGFHDASNGRIRSGAHIFLAEDKTVPR